MHLKPNVIKKILNVIKYLFILFNILTPYKKKKNYSQTHKLTLCGLGK